jgi:ParB family chromosome partitioning protein
MALAVSDPRSNVVRIGDVRPNPWNPNQQTPFIYEKELNSVKKFGMAQPLIVRENKGYEIINGEQRWKAAKELGLKLVPIYNLGRISDDRAKELTILFNEIHGEADQDG